MHEFKDLRIRTFGAKRQERRVTAKDYKRPAMLVCRAQGEIEGGKVGRSSESQWSSGAGVPGNFLECIACIL